MRIKYLLLLVFGLCWINVKAQHPPVFEGMTTDTVSQPLNDLDVKLVKYKYGKSPISFLAIHDDEDTGVKAAFDYIQLNGGSIIDTQYGSQRNFQFNYEGQSYQTDPNSIYSIKGIARGLEKYGKTNDAVVEQLDQMSKSILKFYNPVKLGYIFTLHNNADGGFGISSYLKGYELESVADSVHINFQMDGDDMILVTETALFNRLKKEDVNVVLQHQSADDDGSLSIYAMINKIPYINVEVQHGHREENLRLIEIAVRALKETYPELIKKAADE